MIELIKSIFANASERIKSPLIGTFFTSWIVFNWKAILVLLFSTDDIETKLTVLSDKYYHIWNLVWFPLIVTLVYIFALPYINLGIDWCLNHSSKQRDNRVHKNKVDSIEDEIKIANKKIELEDKYKTLREKSDYNQQVDALNNDVKILERQLKNETEASKKVINKLNEENAKLVKIITDSSQNLTKLQKENINLNNIILKVPNSENMNKIFSEAFKIHIDTTNSITDNLANAFKYVSENGLNSIALNRDFSNAIKNQHDIYNIALTKSNEPNIELPNSIKTKKGK